VGKSPFLVMKSFAGSLPKTSSSWVLLLFSRSSTIACFSFDLSSTLNFSLASSSSSGPPLLSRLPKASFFDLVTGEDWASAWAGTAMGAAASTAGVAAGVTAAAAGAEETQ